MELALRAGGGEFRLSEKNKEPSGEGGRRSVRREEKQGRFGDKGGGGSDRFVEEGSIPRCLGKGKKDTKVRSRPWGVESAVPQNV